LELGKKKLTGGVERSDKKKRAWPEATLSSSEEAKKEPDYSSGQR